MVCRRHVARGLRFYLFLDPTRPLSMCGLFLLPLCVKTIRIQEPRHKNAAHTRTKGCGSLQAAPFRVLLRARQLISSMVDLSSSSSVYGTLQALRTQASRWPHGEREAPVHRTYLHVNTFIDLASCTGVPQQGRCWCIYY